MVSDPFAVFAVLAAVVYVALRLEERPCYYTNVVGCDYCVIVRLAQTSSPD